MLTASKSLLMHSNVEKIYFLIEDDVFPYELPPEIECINVANQEYFPQNGPNYNNVCTYMVLLRAAYTKIFPELNTILSLDIDTVINENISELWELNLDNYYLAAAKEKNNSDFITAPYVNFGVVMFNLKKLRDDRKDDEIINALNTYFYQYKEQDCFNELCYNNILFLSNDYNNCVCGFSTPQHEKITHFARFRNLNQFPNFNYYKQLSFSELQRNVKDSYDLDIIIPTYKNKNGLRKTLNSIPQSNNINIIVIDDYSDTDYKDIIEEYPWIQLYTTEKNCGPGIARQCGMSIGKGMYVLFLDTGDYFYEDGLQTIMEQIQKNTYIKMYSFSYVIDSNNRLSDILDFKTIGKVYKRSFLEMHNICFNEQGSYANEDYGFIMAVKLIIQEQEKLGFTDQIKHIKMPTFYQHIDKNSLTYNKNNNFNYSKRPQGIIINGVNAVNIAYKNNVSLQFLLEAYNEIITREYTYLLDAAINQQESLKSIWLIIREFYLNYYRPYIKLQKNNMSLLTARTLQLINNHKLTFSKHVHVNFYRFICELETEEEVPNHYYNDKNFVL